MDADKLEQIRRRDARWRDKGSRLEMPSRDRRELLQFVDELEQLAVQVQQELATLKTAMRSKLNAQPAAQEPHE